MEARSVLYSLEKDGSSEAEWEDGAGFDDGALVAGQNPRFVVVDGATEAFDSLRWVEQLVTSFLDRGSPSAAPEAPTLDQQSMRRWFELMQQRWLDEAPTFASIIEERKFAREGSMATLLGCELTDLDGPAPGWRAVALGDTVLFHVRDGRRIQHFPALRAQDFGSTPFGVRTVPSALEQMAQGVTFASGDLRVGDVLFLATDALAHWMVQRDEQDPHRLWTALSVLDHDYLFAQLVSQARAAQEMKNDDVTLLRVQVIAAPAEFLVVCL
jgi:hypothetical protein